MLVIINFYNRPFVIAKTKYYKEIIFMKLVFDNIKTKSEYILISLDGGLTHIRKPVAELIAHGFEFNNENCSDLDNIKLSVDVFKPTYTASNNETLKNGNLEFCLICNTHYERNTYHEHCPTCSELLSEGVVHECPEEFIQCPTCGKEYYRRDEPNHFCWDHCDICNQDFPWGEHHEHCPSCNELIYGDHECPNEEVMCPDCGESYIRGIGHECRPNALCDICGEEYNVNESHICPTVICDVCGEEYRLNEGHVCQTCSYCGMSGHMYEECPQRMMDEEMNNNW